MQYNYPYPQMQNFQQFQQSYYTPQVPYQPQTATQIQQPNNLPMQQQNAVTSPKFDVVQGELAASMYQTENGQEVILLDMDNPFVYHKKRGLDGKLEPMKKFQLVEVTEEKKHEVDMKEYVKQEELESIIETIVRNEVDRKLSEITLKASTKKKTEE